MGYPHSVLGVLPAPGLGGILQGIFRSAPTKILFAGTDFLLTSSFRGGLGGLRAGSVLCAGPRPLSNSNLRLVQSSGEGQLPFQPVEVIKGNSQKADNVAIPISSGSTPSWWGMGTHSARRGTALPWELGAPQPEARRKGMSPPRVGRSQ